MKLTRVVALLCLVTCLSIARGAAAQVIISEYVEGSSNNKAIELYNAGESAVDLTGGTLQMYFNGSGSPGLTLNLRGTVAPGDVYVIAHSSAHPAILAHADLASGSGFFNGDDAIVLRLGGVVVDSLGQVGFDPGTQWGTGLVSTADNTLRRKSGVCTGDVTPTDVFDPSVEWDGFDNDTFDGLGSHDCSGSGGGDPEPEPVLAVEIFDIQGAGMSSSLAGQQVLTTANVVTAVGPSGFFLQTPDYRVDASVETSNGIYVYTGQVPVVSVGDLVDVEGRVVEFFDLTEISQPVVTVRGSGQSLPAAVFFDETTPSRSATRPANEMERYEGMRVSVPVATVAAATDQYGDTPVVAGGQRPFREPGIHYPGVPGLPVWDGNPEIFELAPKALGLGPLVVAGGESITSIEGVLAYAFGDYQVWPTTYAHSGTGPVTRPVRSRAAGELTVGAQNMYRFFDDRNDPAIGEPVLSSTAYQARLAKLSRQVREVLGAPDVLAVSEVESQVALGDLAARINGDGGLDYTAHVLEGNDVGGIDTGFLIRGSIVLDALWQHGRDEIFTLDGSLLNDRPPLVLEGTYAGNGAPFAITVIAVHQRSLNGIDGSGGDRVRRKRLAQAESLARLVQSLQTEDPSRRIVVAGDFNAFEFTDGYVDVMGVVTGKLDPLGAMLEGSDLLAPDMVNEVTSVAAADRYSYVHEGSAQVLDHVLTSSSLGRFVRDLQFSRGNADVSEFLSSSSEPLRSSDHDGLVLFVMTDFDGDSHPDDEDGCSRGDARPTVIIDGCDSGVANPVSASGCSLSDAIHALRAGAPNHGAFVSQLSRMLNDLVRQGRLTGAEKGAIQSCAARSN